MLELKKNHNLSRFYVGFTPFTIFIVGIVIKWYLQSYTTVMLRCHIYGYYVFAKLSIIKPGLSHDPAPMAKDMEDSKR